MMAAALVIAGVVIAGTSVVGWCALRVAAWADDRMALVDLDRELDELAAGEVDQ